MATSPRFIGAYPISQCRHSPRQGLGLLSALSNAAGTVARWHERARTNAGPLVLNEYLMRDIGVTRTELLFNDAKTGRRQ